ncbi:MAG: GIY-YIG nuclease family protein [bacterium]
MYLLLDKDDQVVYVGQTQNLRARQRQHNMSAKTQKLDHVAVAWFDPGIPSLHTRLVVESILVVTRCPVGNSALLLKITKNNQLAEIRYARKPRLKKRPA